MACGLSMLERLSLLRPKVKEMCSPLPSLTYLFLLPYTFPFSHASIFHLSSDQQSERRRRGGVNRGQTNQKDKQEKLRASMRKCAKVAMKWWTGVAARNGSDRRRVNVAVCACVCFLDMAISWNGCPWTQVCANRYLSVTDRPSTGNYTARSTAGVTGLSTIYINLHVSLGLAAASGTPYESCSHSADNLFKFNKKRWGKG